MGELRPKRFRVQNYRNINDSGWIDLAKVTAFVGRNESGKTTLLRALHKFNPATPQAYSPQREFPRDLFTAKFRNAGDWPVCSVDFEISPELAATLKELMKDAEPPARVIFTRYYDGSLKWSASPPPIDKPLNYSDILPAIDKFRTAVMKLAHPTPESEGAYQGIRTELLQWTSPWRAKFDQDGSLRVEAGRKLLDALRAESDSKVRPEAAELFPPFQKELDAFIKEANSPTIARRVYDALVKAIPVFIYFDNYGVLDSAVYLPRFIEDMDREPGSPRVRTVNAMFKHVNLSAKEIMNLGRGAITEAQKSGQAVTQEMIAADQQQMELRRIKLNSASLDITKRFSDWWEQRRHNIRYDADGDFFRIWVSDDKRPGIDIELEGRSAGFQWFFSFYLVFLVESEEGHKDAVLLLDEPGLHLHPTAQQELISFFEELAQKNQLIYSTHSPFLIDGEHIERVRPVTEDESGHSRISNDSWPRDRDTIFPLQAAAGYALVKGLFQHKKNVLVEGMSEYFFLMALSLQCRAKGKVALPDDVYITPCGGTKLVGHLASLFLGQQVRPLVLLDADEAGRVRRDALMKELYVGYAQGILLLDEVIDQVNCEIEDVVGEDVLLPLVWRVVGREFSLNATDEDGVGVAGRIKLAAKLLNVELPEGWKAEVARQFALECGASLNLPDAVLDRASLLFSEMRKRLDEINAKPT